ncbi:MAG TPA: hypothetical protein VMY38_04695 [Gemmatimonadaceae bacterium]|nr:hypothetical protein [Gemmatimonadaceae bacterium]
MKRLALVAAVLFAVACTAKDDAATTDTAAPAMAPAPAAMDTGMRMDTMATDTTTRDTTP